MRYGLVLGAAFGLAGSEAFAQGCAAVEDDAARLACYDEAATGQCEVEDWRYYQQVEGFLGIEGVTSCPNGRMSFQLYDGEEFLASDTAYIEGFGFKTFVNIAEMPENMTIRYVIEPE